MIETAVCWFGFWLVAAFALLQTLNGQTLRQDRDYWRSNYLRLIAAYDQLHSKTLEKENRL